ncbi:MAG: methylated-DNA--[protein]-cysteine S-methyltransferase [Pseudomonadota bacterium]|jgi:AraC family transcriptional regulator of adaptative response/methylated-DNA-[protein]-cysteine methyltransferase|nr:methylated-DNA--[protein]-cysteine S-methyltransferase [Alphaproteobacteria bacterium]
MKKISQSTQLSNPQELKSAWIETPLGLMVAIANDKELYFLEFVERDRLDEKIEKFSRNAKANIIPGNTHILKLVESELKEYFCGELKTFNTPLHLTGSSFQKSAWNELLKTPYGKTRSYTEQAVALGKPVAFRAVANANGANNIAIIIPCHRIISHDGKLGGYSSGIAKKKWLLELERKSV